MHMKLLALGMRFVYIGTHDFKLVAVCKCSMLCLRRRMMDIVN